MPLVYTRAFAGYSDNGGPFRFIATTMTVPKARHQRPMDTADGTHAGAVVAYASVLSNAGQNFSVWPRHR